MKNVSDLSNVTTPGTTWTTTTVPTDVYNVTEIVSNADVTTDDKLLLNLFFLLWATLLIVSVTLSLTRFSRIVKAAKQTAGRSKPRIRHRNERRRVRDVEATGSQSQLNTNKDAITSGSHHDSHPQPVRKDRSDSGPSEWKSERSGRSEEVQRAVSPPVVWTPGRGRSESHLLRTLPASGKRKSEQLLVYR